MLLIYALEERAIGLIAQVPGDHAVGASVVELIT